MFTSNEPELLKNMFIQDRRINDANYQNYLKDNIAEKNEHFFFKYQELYRKNILLKNKLNDVLEEKRILNQNIIKLEQNISVFLNNNNNSIKNKMNIEPYKKQKRNRRKKTELKNIFYCNYINCGKSYPSKSSLNMHIKLKHHN